MKDGISFVKNLMVFVSVLFMLFAQESVLIDDTIEECPPCESCDGHCLSDEVVQGLRTSILTLENNKETGGKIIENLNSQIYMYIQTIENDSLLIVDYKKQLELKEEMIDLVKPKWYENRYLWFGYGVTLTVGSVILAGQLK